MKFTFYVDSNGVVHCALPEEVLLTQVIIESETMDEALQILRSESHENNSSI
jgi:hypothetical protein